MGNLNKSKIFLLEFQKIFQGKTRMISKNENFVKIYYIMRKVLTLLPRRPGSPFNPGGPGRPGGPGGAISHASPCNTTNNENCYRYLLLIGYPL